MSQKYDNLKSNYDRLDHFHHANIRCLNLLLQDKVRWFKKGNYSLGVCDPLGSCGPYLIVNFHPKGQDPFANCFWFDEWMVEEISPLYRAGSSDPDTLDLIHLAQRAKEWIFKQEKRLRAADSPQAGKDEKGEGTIDGEKEPVCTSTSTDQSGSTTATM